MRRVTTLVVATAAVGMLAAAPMPELFQRTLVTPDEALARELAGQKGPLAADGSGLDEHGDHGLDGIDGAPSHRHGPVDDPQLASTGDEMRTDASDGVTLRQHFPFDGIDDLFSGGTDLAFHGDLIFAPQFGDAGGVHIFQRSGPNVRQVGFFSCPGTQNDVAVLDADHIVLGFHSGGDPDSDCVEEGGGVRVIDVSDPRRPVERGNVLDIPQGTHTLKVHPEEPIIYASPGGIANSGGVQQIIDASDPDAPFVGGQFAPNATGCHDVSFSVTDQRDRDLVACVGLTESQLWDITDDPFEPETIARIVNPAIFFHHSAAISDDGDLLIIGDENFGAHECEGGPTGAMFAYDISNPQLPVPTGFFGIDRHGGDDPHVSSSTVDRSTWCTAHQYDFIPGSRVMVASWYTGGMNVIDWTDPMRPEELAHYRVDGPAFENTNYWSAYWHDGLVYANDRGRGMDVIHVPGLPDADHPSLARPPRRGR